MDTVGGALYMKQIIEEGAAGAAPGQETMIPLIETAHISKRFGGIVALNDAQMKCYRGETHVLIGENGAGKSTMVKIICGVTARDSGDIYMEGQKIDINSAQDAQAHKIAAVFQELSLIQDLSVAENIFLANEPRNRFGRINLRQIYDKAQVFLQEIGLDLNPRVMVRQGALQGPGCADPGRGYLRSGRKRGQVAFRDDAQAHQGTGKGHFVHLPPHG